MDVPDNEDRTNYYGAFILVRSTAAHLCTVGRKTATQDACSCDVIGLQSYGMASEVIFYDSNHHVVPFAFGHVVGT